MLWTSFFTKSMLVRRLWDVFIFFSYVFRLLRGSFKSVPGNFPPLRSQRIYLYGRILTRSSVFRQISKIKKGMGKKWNSLAASEPTELRKKLILHTIKHIGFMGTNRNFTKKKSQKIFGIATLEIYRIRFYLLLVDLKRFEDTFSISRWNKGFNFLFYITSNLVEVEWLRSCHRPVQAWRRSPLQ